MLARLDSFRSVIALWPSHDALARDIGAPVSAVRKWAQRNRIPAEWWTGLLKTKIAASAGVSSDRLASLIERRRA